MKNEFIGPEMATIECGIGTIDYSTDNLQLQSLMEALNDKIQSIGPLGTLQLLSNG